MELVNTNQILELNRGKKIVSKNIILLLAGKMVSLFGSNIYQFAISLYILKVTGSALSFGLSFALGVLPRVIFGPISGVMTDRFNRKRMVVILDLISGIIVLSLFAMTIVDQLRLPYIYLTTFLLATSNTFFNTALNASTPNLVDDDNLMRVNSLSQAVASICAISGPFIAGVIYAFVDIRLFLLINGLSFIVSGISEIFINFNVKEMYFKVAEEEQDEIEEDKTSKTSFWGDLIEGLRYIKTQRWLIVLGSFVIFFNLLIIMGLTIPIPYIVINIFKFKSQQYGMLNMMFPIGMLVASIALSLLPEAKSNYKRMIICIFTFSFAILLVGMLTSQLFGSFSNGSYLIVLMTLYLVMAVASIFINVPIGVIMQRTIPNDKLGRVEGTLGTLATGLTPIGAIIGGLLVDQMKPWILPIICGVVMIILTLLMLRVKELKSL